MVIAYLLSFWAFFFTLLCLHRLFCFSYYSSSFLSNFKVLLHIPVKSTVWTKTILFMVYCFKVLKKANYIGSLLQYAIKQSFSESLSCVQLACEITAKNYILSCVLWCKQVICIVVILFLIIFGILINKWLELLHIYRIILPVHSRHKIYGICMLNILLPLCCDVCYWRHNSTKNLNIKNGIYRCTENNGMV